MCLNLIKLGFELSILRKTAAQN